MCVCTKRAFEVPVIVGIFKLSEYHSRKTMELAKGISIKIEELEEKGKKEETRKRRDRQREDYKKNQMKEKLRRKRLESTRELRKPLPARGGKEETEEQVEAEQVEEDTGEELDENGYNSDSEMSFTTHSQQMRNYLEGQLYKQLELTKKVAESLVTFDKKMVKPARKKKTVTTRGWHMPDVGRKGTNLATEYVTWFEKQESNMAQFVEDTSIL